jgi:hypothetical protein
MVYKEQKFYFSQFWKLGSPRLRCLPSHVSKSPHCERWKGWRKRKEGKRERRREEDRRIERETGKR